MIALKKLLNSTAGNVGPILAVAAVPLLLSAGVGIDMARMHNTRTTLQAAADAAAVAGATSQIKKAPNIKGIVEDYLSSNNSGEVLKQITDVSYKIDNKAGTFTVRIEGMMDSSLMKLAGIDAMDVGVESVVNLGTQALEIALVLDNTGSMAGSKIDNLKNAATELINIIEKSKSDYSSATIGLVPFSEYVNVGPANAAQPWMNNAIPAGWEGCVGSRNAPRDEALGTSGEKFTAVTGSYCTKPLIPLTADFNSLRSAISLMAAEGNTYIPAGILWGWNLLDDGSPFTEGMSKSELKDVGGRRAMVVMTDGENTIVPVYPEHLPGDVTVSNSKLTTLCQKVKDDDIEVFTVSFMVPSDTIKQLLIDCATDPSHYFDADNSTELFKSFQEIGNQLAAVRFIR